jgi:hypothetical protein
MEVSGQVLESDASPPISVGLGRPQNLPGLVMGNKKNILLLPGIETMVAQPTALPMDRLHLQKSWMGL